ncbi:hybrid sensor histidine kinase/response regulator transcription factor [Maribacter cobaltidurans]|uniref:histidine kinase n=1 Tax=Maribacter cobaltidurans TaxID=1178778 RepID=A0A223V2U5_9FLAO|nr:hybrid sensor histidine kinase/response regulator transcription factor [Maribacter cobaltidurans]ASV29567.1 hypothetical protein CJ263_04695 [Maribacter cobaltidurans]GGD67878.1 hybrid sensor histidine kinase/response regulator [Maribacter cobaltidurans]
MDIGDIFGRYTWGILYVLCLFQPLSAQESTYSFEDLEEPITQRAVSTIVQDQKGLIWIGTYGVGLNKYNGSDIVAYKQEFDNPNSLNSSLVHTSYIDSANQLWIGTEVGLNIYQSKYDNFKQVSFYNEGILLNTVVVNAIVEVANDKLLIGSIANGLFEVDVETLKGKSVSIGNHVSVPIMINCMVRHGSGKIFIGSNKGLFEYDNGQIKKVIFKDEVLTSNSDVNVESLLIDTDGSLWMGTHSKGLMKVVTTFPNQNSLHVYEITTERILTMVQAPDGNILCGTENDGLFVVSKEGDLVKNYRYDKFDLNSIKSNSVWSLFVDRQERIWIGYYNKGVGVYDRYYDKFKDIQSLPNVQNSLQSSSVTGIIKDLKNRLWIGMDGGGIDVYDLDTKKIVHLLEPDNGIANGLGADDVQTLFLDSQDNLWVGTWNSGIFFLPKNKKVFQHFHMENTNNGLKSNRVMSFSEDVNGKIWIGTFSNGLHYYDYQKRSFGFVDDKLFTDLKTNRAEIRKILVDHKNEIWVATTSGLFKRPANSSSTFSKVVLKTTLEEENSLKTSIDVIVSLYEDKNQNVWIGTDGAGVWRYTTKDDSIKWFNKEHGLQQETIATIIESDDGRLWMAGNKGLSCFDKSRNQITNYDTYDGLLTNDFNFNAAYKDTDGTLYFGNYKGVNIVEPANIPINKKKPEVYFTDFKIYNKSVDIHQKDSPLQQVISETDQVTLNHRQGVFTIEFMGINFTRPEKNQYAYYMEGLEDTWNYVGNTRSATYTNLSPGEYVFKVKAANNDGIWNDEVTTLELNILAPWWKTHMAIACYLVIIILFSSWLYRLLKERIREKRLVQLERAKRIQEEELNDRKIQFFTNISHEFRTPLTLILNPLNDIMSNSSYELPKAVHDKHNIVYKNATRLKRLIDELMDFRKLQLNKFSIKVSEIDAHSFVKEITNHFKEEAILKNIAMLLEYEKLPISLWSDPGLLEKIIFNILSNAFKVTPENGTITIGVTQCSNDVVFSLIDEKNSLPAVEIYIEDTGSGINQEEVKKIFDRFYQVKNMNSQYYGGTGIGLEVVKNFVDLLKGEIIVESEVSVGTKFRIFLPLGNDHFNTDEMFVKQNNVSFLPEQNSIQTEISPDLENDLKRTLLIVEDNTELRSYLKYELSFEYNILEASNGLQGLEIATKKSPDLIITDVVMPELDGVEFSRALKSNLGTSHIPIIMLTAKIMGDDKIKGVNAGADVYLTKPFDMGLLNSYLKRLIENRQVYINKNLNDPNKLSLLEKTTDMDKSFMQKVLDHLNKNIDKSDLNVEHLADDMHLSRSQLYRKIKAMTGLTPNELIRKVRLEKAKKMIENGSESIAEVGFKVGFSSPSYFSRCFKSEFGVLPTELKTK